jgi:WD40 repeat protein/serine/threonine protein kinase
MDLTSEREAAIFSAARRLPVEERAFYLDGACAGDPLLRRQIEELLKADESAGAFLAELAARGEGPARGGAVLDLAATLEAAPGRSEQPGDTIDRYKLMEKIGEGGFGVVYVAEQKEPVKRRVALKVIKLGMDTRQVVARFEAERQALAMMDHPNIAKVLDAGTTQTGRPYFVMELVRGIRITDYCDEANLSTRQRLELFIQVCQAIQHAHQKGIIHRDIKPSNILVTLHDGVPVPKVIDFGIAKATEGRLTEATVYTQLHQFIGTPAYMSPEQAEMSGLDIDTRSDIYSLGVLLYELLVGSTPFDAKELVASGLEAMRKTIREQEPVRPSTKLATLPGEKLTTTAKRRSVEGSRLVHLLRGDLDWIVMKCLEKDRSRRYETANGLAADLKRHLNNEPVVARPPSNLYRLQKMVRRNKLAFAAAGAVAAALVLGLGASTWLFIRESQAHNQAVAAERKQSQLTEEAKAAQAKEAEQRQRAVAGEAAARQRELEARRNLYAADMNLATTAIAANNLGYALELLDRHRPEPGQPDLRGWEWRYLWKQTRSDAQTLGAHSDTVQDAVFSPKGDLLATCSGDRTVKVWDMVRRRKIATLPHEQPVRTAVFLSEGKALATASADGLLRVWDLESLKEVARLSIGTIAPASEQSGLAFSPRGELVAVTEPDGTVNVWNVGSKAKTATLQYKPNARCLAFSWDARVLAAGRRGDALVELFDVARQERIYSLTNAAEGVSALAFSRDGRMLACAGWDLGRDGPPIRVWDLGTRQTNRTLSGHTTWIPQLAFSPDGKTLASASADHTAKLWEMDTGQSTTLRGHLNEVWAIAFAPDGQSLVTGIRDPGYVALWSAVAKPAEKSEQVISSFAENVRRDPMLSSDGTALLKVYDEKGIGVWDTDTLTERTRFPLPVDPTTRLAISSRGKLIGRGEADGSLRLIEVATRREAAILSQRGAGIGRLSFSRDGSKLVAASADRKIRIWDVTTQKLLHEIEGHPSGVVGFESALAFSADGLILGVGYEDDIAELFDVRGGKRLALLRGHKAGVCGAILLPDGKTAVTASFDQSVKIWDVPTQRELESLHGEALALFSMALSPDGRRLAAGGPEGVVRLWDPSTRQLVAAIKGPAGECLSALAFSPDGDALVARTTSLLRVWRAPSLAEINAAEAEDKARAQGP